jgi:hypothetical protein
MKTIAAYIMIVTFYGAALQGQGGTHDWAALKGSPYDGVAVRLLGAYDVSEPDYDALLAGMLRVRDEAGMDPWPFVFINRMVGLPEKSVRMMSFDDEARDEFSSIKGMDVFDEKGARTAFVNLWKASARLARETGSPGAILDLEIYNDGGMYRVDKLAERLGVSEDETVSGLESIGRELADVTNEEYPDAVVWTLLAGMSQENYNWTGRMLSIGYISKGFLDRCKEKGYKMKYVAGGEHSLGYCPGPLNKMKDNIFKRAKSYSKHTGAYPANLVLGGTIAPWDDPDKRTGWLAGCDCGGCDATGVRGLLSHFVELMTAYDYVWIYAASAAPYDPYDRDISAPYSETLSVAKGLAAMERTERPAPIESASIRRDAP